MNLSNSSSRRLAIAASIGLLILASPGKAEMSSPQDTAGANPAYRAGYKLGQNLVRLVEQGATNTILEDALKGVCEGFKQAGKQVGKDQICDTYSPLQNNTARDKGGNRALDDFAVLNARRPGVIVLPSSVQYEVMRQGSGRKATAGDSVLVSYRAYLPDGRVFDTTYAENEPLRMALDEIAVPGLKQAISMMREGDQWRVVIPPKMGFGRSGNNRLRRHVLIYEIELLSTAKSGH